MNKPAIADVKAGDWIRIRTSYGPYEGVWEGHCWGRAGRLIFAGGDILREAGGDLGVCATELLEHRRAPISEPAGLGAIVKDVDGRMFTRWTQRQEEDSQPSSAWSGRRQSPWIAGFDGVKYRWEEIPPPVTIIDEGIEDPR